MINQHLKSKLNLTLIASFIALTVALAPIVMAAGPTAPNPSGYTYSSISIPGATSQWTSCDFFTYLYEAFDSSHAQDGTAWLLYNPDTQTAYVLVLVKSPDWIGLTSSADTWVRIDGDTGSTKVTFTSFVWVNEGYQGAGNAEGYMASFTVTPGSHTIRIHMAVSAADDFKTQKTAGTPGDNFPLVLIPSNRIPETPIYGVTIALLAAVSVFAAFKLRKTNHNLNAPKPLN